MHEFEALSFDGDRASGVLAFGGYVILTLSALLGRFLAPGEPLLPV